MLVKAKEMLSMMHECCKKPLGALEVLVKMSILNDEGLWNSLSLFMTRDRSRVKTLNSNQSLGSDKSKRNILRWKEKKLQALVLRWINVWLLWKTHTPPFWSIEQASCEAKERCPVNWMLVKFYAQISHQLDIKFHPAHHALRNVGLKCQGNETLLQLILEGGQTCIN